MLHVTLKDHPLLEAALLEVHLPRPVRELQSPEDLTSRLSPTAAAPLHTDDEVRAAVRRLLRHGGFKPSGRSKPASEYLAQAAGKGELQPINVVVDACNLVSLHSGLPISVIDLDRATLPLHIAVAAPGERYAFNPTGQEIDVSGLISLHDAQGPCAGPVKDAQRTKTHDDTVRTLSVLWGTRELPGRTAEAAAWYGQILEALGASIVPVRVEPQTGPAPATIDVT